VVGRAEGWIDESRALRTEQSSRVVDSGCGQGRFGAKGRQYSWQPSSQHTFSGAGRTAEQHPVSSCGGDDKTSLRGFLPPHFAKTKRTLGGGANGCRRSRKQATIPSQVIEDRRKIRGGEDIEPRHERSRTRPTRGCDNRLAARFVRREGHGEFASNAAKAAVERQFADKCGFGGGSGFDCAGRHQNPNGDCQVKSRAPFAQGRGSEIHRDSILREWLADSRDGGSHPGSALANRKFGETDDVDSRQLGANANLDFDSNSIDSHQGGSKHTGHRLYLRGTAGLDRVVVPGGRSRSLAA